MPIPAKGPRQPAVPAAAAGGPDLTRSGSNAAAGPSGAPPKAVGRLRVRLGITCGKLWLEDESAFEKLSGMHF